MAHELFGTQQEGVALDRLGRHPRETEAFYIPGEQDMARVRLTTEEQQPWVVSGERSISEEERGKLRHGELTSSFRVREPGSDHNPQLVELRYQPGAEIRLHSHDEDEIIYVLTGEMRINNRVVGPGATLTVPGGVFYGFHAGEQGLTILNFRPRPDASFNLPPGHEVR
jgi:quercetin dioxygenase-like cupin family protein